MSAADFEKRLAALYAELRGSLQQQIEAQVLRERQAFAERGRYTNDVDEKGIVLRTLAAFEKKFFACTDFIVQHDALREFFPLFELLLQQASSFPKARVASMVYRALEKLERCGESATQCLEICQQLVAWCDAHNLLFLRTQLQIKVAGYYLALHNFEEGPRLVAALLEVVKKDDDKLKLIELYLLQARFALHAGHLTECKSCLTCAKTTANKVSCTTSLQAEIDMLSGLVQCFNLDYPTAVSYLLEAYDAYNTLRNLAKATDAYVFLMFFTALQDGAASFRKMQRGVLLDRILEQPKVKAMAEIVQAYAANVLEVYHAVLEKHRALLQQDRVLLRQIELISENVVHRAIVKALVPYSSIKLEKLAALTKLSAAVVEKHLAKMVIDERIDGIIDHQTMVFHRFENSGASSEYALAKQVCDNLGRVVSQMLFHVDKEIDVC